MSIFSQTLFAFVSGHFMSFSFFSARHVIIFLNSFIQKFLLIIFYLTFSFTCFTNTFAGLKAGM